jgi:hypothetical protein
MGAENLKARGSMTTLLKLQGHFLDLLRENRALQLIVESWTM